MRADASLSLPATYDVRPERKDYRSSLLDSAAAFVSGGIVRNLRARTTRMRSIVSRVEQYGPALKAMKDGKLKEVSEELRIHLHRHGFQEDLVAHAFALVREVAERTVGLRHFDCQLVGGMVLLKGMVAEMETGEGKTLAATLAACTAALAGVPVHVITVNDYLTVRDAQWMGPIYEGLGLRVGYVAHHVRPEERRSAYQCDITYCTNKELVFDYLRDRLKLGDRVDPLRLQAEYLYGKDARVRQLLLRGLHFAIVDEADSILVDEARTPLIISGMAGSDEGQLFMEQAMTLADSLQRKVDYTIDETLRSIDLTTEGKRRIRELAVPLGPLWKGTLRREEMVRQGLVARHLFRRDEHYIVQDGKVQIVDEFTGRLMLDRFWERGLQQLIEIKEGCEITKPRETLARISYQRFFRRYLRLAGMTGTAWEVRSELWSVYGLPVVRIPTNRPTIRKRHPDRIFFKEDEKWQALVEKVRHLHAEGRPVLVGTRSVAASEQASRRLRDAGLEHQVLNAKQDREEAEIIARAGELGRITIATNMAGRGTDIKLGPGVVERQGLHVFLTERHEAARIDRQLAGRCGRQGDPGSHEALLSLGDPLMAAAGRGGLLEWTAGWLLRRGTTIWTWVGQWAILRAQKRMERVHARMRKDLLKRDQQQGDMLAFSGRQE